MIHMRHTSGLPHIHLPYIINHHLHFSCFRQLYNRMTTQILVWPWFKVTGVRKSKTFCANLSQCLSHLNGIWCTIETCGCDEPHTHFILSIEYSRKRTLFMRRTKSIQKRLNACQCARLRTGQANMTHYKDPWHSYMDKTIWHTWKSRPFLCF